MLVLQGVLRGTATLGGGVNRKTGEQIPLREVLQIETIDDRGLVKVDTITVPNSEPYRDKVGKTVNVPVRPWATGGAQVRYAFAEKAGAA